MIYHQQMKQWYGISCKRRKSPSLHHFAWFQTYYYIIWRYADTYIDIRCNHIIMMPSFWHELIVPSHDPINLCNCWGSASIARFFAIWLIRSFINHDTRCPSSITSVTWNANDLGTLSIMLMSSAILWHTPYRVNQRMTLLLNGDGWASIGVNNGWCCYRIPRTTQHVWGTKTRIRWHHHYCALATGRHVV